MTVKRDRFPRIRGQGAEAKAARAIIRGLLSCPMCGKSLGDTRDELEICRRCWREYHPTELELAITLTGSTVAEIAAFAKVTTRTVIRARRGDPVSQKSAEALSKVTGIAVEKLRKGSG